MELSANSKIEETGEDDISFIMADYSMPFLNGIPSSLHDSLTESQYGKVVFHDIADSYPTDSDVCCRYSLTSGVQIQEGDYVAVFRVGWNEIDEALLKHPAYLPDQNPAIKNGENRPGQVLFRADALPKDEQEFYQLCYVTTGGAVCGASVPFQFRRPHEEELCAIESMEGECEMVVVRSRTAIAEERLRKVVQDHDEVSREKLKLLSDIAELSEKLEKAETERDDAKKEIELCKKETQELRDMLEGGRQKERQFSKLQRDMQTLDEGRTQAFAQLHFCEQQIEMLTATMQTLSADKARMADLLRENVLRGDDVTMQLSKAILEKTQAQEALEELRQSATDKSQQQAIIIELERKLAQSEQAAIELSQHLAEAREVARNAERERQDLELLREHRNNLEYQLETMEQSYKDRLSQLVDTRAREKELVVQVAQLRQQLAQPRTSEGSVQTEPTLAQTDCEQCEAAGMQVSLLEKQVKNLCMRLDLGAEEYRRVYLEKHRVERKLAKSSTKSPKSKEETELAQTHTPASPTKGSELGGAAASPESDSMHSCPMCGVTFPPGASDLFTKHFDNHLS